MQIVFASLLKPPSALEVEALSMIQHHAAAVEGNRALALQDETNKSASGGGRIAAVVPAYPPDYDVFLDFVHGWQHCQQGMEAMDLMPIFTNVSDQTLFFEGDAQAEH